MSTVFAKRCRRVVSPESVPKDSVKSVLKLAAGSRLAGCPAVGNIFLFHSPCFFSRYFAGVSFPPNGINLSRERSAVLRLCFRFPAGTPSFVRRRLLLLLFSWRRLISLAHILASCCSSLFAFCGLTISLCSAQLQCPADSRPLSFLSVHLLKRILSC